MGVLLSAPTYTLLVADDPAYDPDFGCADFYVLLGLDRVDPRYLRHYLGDPR